LNRHSRNQKIDKSKAPGFEAHYLKWSCWYLLDEILFSHIGVSGIRVQLILYKTLRISPSRYYFGPRSILGVGVGAGRRSRKGKLGRNYCRNVVVRSLGGREDRS